MSFQFSDLSLKFPSVLWEECLLLRFLVIAITSTTKLFRLRIETVQRTSVLSHVSATLEMAIKDWSFTAGQPRMRQVRCPGYRISGGTIPTLLHIQAEHLHKTEKILCPRHFTLKEAFSLREDLLHSLYGTV